MRLDWGAVVVPLPWGLCFFRGGGAEHSVPIALRRGTSRLYRVVQVAIIEPSARDPVPLHTDVRPCFIHEKRLQALVSSHPAERGRKERAPVKLMAAEHCAATVSAVQTWKAPSRGEIRIAELALVLG